MMLLLNYTAYTPFGKLMRVLQAKGFVNKDDRPTVMKVKRMIDTASPFPFKCVPRGKNKRNA
jgi:hypothetical protein